MPYFSPRSGTETDPSTEYVSELSSTAQEVRRALAIAESPFELPETATTLYTLLTDVMLNPEIPVSQILSMRAPRNVDAPKLFENMWTILFSLGVVPGFESAIIHEGRVDQGTKALTRGEVLAMLKRQKIGTSSASGASDITFQMPTEGRSQMVFCTSKYFKQEKSADKYDIQNIIASAEASPQRKEFDYRVLVLTNDRETAEQIFNRALRRYITYLARDGILGRTDLEASITRLRERALGQEDPIKFIEETFFADRPPRPFLELRFHQELIVEKTLTLMETGSKTALWGVVARGGKTYMCGGLIRAMLPKLTSVFIVLGAYTETSTQFMDDLLRKFEDFKDTEVIDVKNEVFQFNIKKKYIFVLSSELLKATSAGNAKERKVMEFLKKGTLKPELLFFDEVHKGGTTELATKSATLFGENAFSVYMTATYIKALLNSEFEIGMDNLISWGYEDIQKAKSITSSETQLYFQKKYGVDLYNKVVSAQNARGVSVTDIQAQYEKFPDLQFLNTDFSPEFLANMTEQYPERGFSMRALLATSQNCSEVPFEKRWECLSNPVSVATFLNYMGPAHEQITKMGTRPVPKLKTDHIMTRIGRASQVTGDVLKNADTEFIPHSQLWFLPTGADGFGNLNSVLTCTASALLHHPWFRKNFSIVCVASGFNPRTDQDYKFDGTGVVKFLNSDEIKNKILTLEDSARKEGRGVLILAGMMLTLGVSLPNVNIVGLLDDSESPDLTYQKMFRALTENPGKKTGYVVDINPLRTIRTLYTYTVAEKERFAPVEAREHVDAVSLTQLYLINEDQFLVTSTGNRVTPTAIHEKIAEYIEQVAASFRDIKEELMFNLKEVDLEEEFELAKSALKESKPEPVAVRVGEEREVPDVPSGIDRVELPSVPGEVVPAEPSAPSDVNLRLALNESIQTATILLGVLSPAKTYDAATKYYEENRNNIQEVVYDKVMEQGLFDREQMEAPTLRTILSSGLSKARDKQAVTYLKMVKRVEKAGADQSEVLQIITQELRPKEAARKGRGEVFTPLELVEEMLSHLPAEVWSNPKLTWFDPSNGIGNFPVVIFKKLDECLKSWEPDTAKRQKHIIENMLYMNELAPSNNAIARNLLSKMCGDPECKINLREGDFLTMSEDVKYDIVVGNPPYNQGGVNKGGGSLWPVFVRKVFKMVNPGGYVTFVHPPGWRKFFDPEERENQGSIWNFVRQNWTLLYLNIDDQPRFKESAGVSVVTDYYLFKAEKTDAETEYFYRFNGLSGTGKTNLAKYSFIPHLLGDLTMSILAKIFAAKGDPVRIVYNQSFKPPKDEVPEGEGTKHYHYTDATGKRVYVYKKYGEYLPEYITQSKVMMTYSNSTEPWKLNAFYTEEELGGTNKSMYMLADSPAEGEKLVKFFNSEPITFLLRITQYGAAPFFGNEFRMLNQLEIPAGELKLTKEETEFMNTVLGIKKAKKQTTRRNKKTDS